MSNKKRTVFNSHIGVAVTNILLVYVVMMITRLIFFLVNWSTFAPYMSWQLAGNIFQGAMVFDTSCILYFNALYLLLLLFPLHIKDRNGYFTFLRWLFVITNAIAIAANLGDCVYFQYTGRRTTAAVFNEFSNEGNILSIIVTEFVRHWYLLVAFMVLVWALFRLYRKPDMTIYRTGAQYYIQLIIALILLVPAAIVGIRGSITAGTRPITISNANQYVNRPIETALVLNTPFSIIRTFGKKVFVTPNYMSDKEMAAIFTPEKHPTPAFPDSNKNVVIIILESFGKEYSSFYNSDLDGGKYKGYMPFLDSIAAQSLTFKYSYANGRKSMDAMPSILSSIPMFVETFFLTPASLNRLDGIAEQLDKSGYYSTYYHGGHNITLGFNAFTHATGFKNYTGLDEYCNDKKYNGMNDFDGKWAIWDEPFLQFFADNLAKFHQPFLATVFTASSHHPYKVPDNFKDKSEGNLEIDKCIRYTDMSLRRFFERVSKMPWYKNTLFVITADHTNQTARDEYRTDLGLFEVPIMFFTPDGSIKPTFHTDAICQQIDIMPTVLSYLGKKNTYMAFGCDILTTPPAQTYAINYNNGIYQYVKGDYMLQFDGTKTVAVYHFKTDRLLKHNLVGKVAEQATMEREVKAIIQQYMQRMNTDRLVIN